MTSYKEVQLFVDNLQVINDAAERGIKLVTSGGLAFVPVRHLAQPPPVLEYHLGPPFAPLVSFGAPSLLRYMYI